MNPKYPIYIVSKGRWESRLTSISLELIGVPYYIAVEPQEYEEYAKVIDPKKILVLPFSNHGLGPTLARNWCWEHSIELGAKKHWVMDDNIVHFYRLNKNVRVQVSSGTIFRAAEDFVDRYENVPLAGLQYRFFAIPDGKLPPYVKNTRIYSCLLIENSTPYRWRGKYNEDTDISLRILKDGLCTIQFNSFLQGKVATQTVSGGNSMEFYDHEGTLNKSQYLVDLHPDVSRLTTRYNRIHHYVDYSSFKNNKLIRKKDFVMPEGVDNYGMILQDDEVDIITPIINSLTPNYSKSVEVSPFPDSDIDFQYSLFT